MKYKIISVLLMGYFFCISKANATIDYICLQPEDSVYTTVPMAPVKAILKNLKSEYNGAELFKVTPYVPGVRPEWIFKPIPNLEVVFVADDYENEVVFDQVRFLQVEGYLYTWLRATATKNNDGVIHRVVRNIRWNGKTIVKSGPITFEVRQSLLGCD